MTDYSDGLSRRSFLKLLGARTLSEVPTNDDEIRLGPGDLAFDRFDQPRVVGAEVKVGQMHQASHGACNARDTPQFIDRCG